MEESVVYITAIGARLTRVGERLIVRSREGRIMQDIPMFRIRQIVCMGPVEATHSFLMAISRRDIDLVWLTVDGRFRARFSQMAEQSVTCRLAQYRRADNEEFRLATAKSIVQGKVATERAWLLRRNRRDAADFTPHLLGLGDILRALPDAATTDEVMGLEGTAAKWYFAAFRIMLKQDLGFAERARRPPPDPVNALLSFGYTLLYQRVLSAIEQVGLDPMVSNLHAIQDRRCSLALDLMEEFRLPIVDMVVLGMINRLELTMNDFLPLEGKGFRLTTGGLACFIKGLHERLASGHTDPRDGRKYPWRDLMVRQAWQYKSYVLGEAPAYVSVAIRP